jgi:uncharacterized membrane protein
MSWRNVLSEVGLKESELSVKLKKVAAAFSDLENEKARVGGLLKSTTLQSSEKQKLDAELAEINEAMVTLDENLREEIPNYAKNKPKYDEMSRKMAQGRTAKAKKKKDGGTTEPTPTPPAEPTPTPPAEPTPTTPSEPTEPVDPDKKDDKKGGWGLGEIVLGVGLLALSLGAYNHFKNK